MGKKTYIPGLECYSFIHCQAVKVKKLQPAKMWGICPLKKYAACFDCSACKHGTSMKKIKFSQQQIVNMLFKKSTHLGFMIIHTARGKVVKRLQGMY